MTNDWGSLPRSARAVRDTRPLAIDLFCGLGGWTEGLLAEGWDVIGFDIEQHVYGEHRYPAQLVLQDVLTLDGAQFKDADPIVASPPCQEYSYMAMPWTRAKQIARALRGADGFPDGYTGSRTIAELRALFDACFRLQREACAATGRYIPLVVENVKGAQPWLGYAAWHYGSYYLWGDVPALMPTALKRRMKSQISCAPRLFSDRVASTPEEAHALHYRLPSEATKNSGGSWFNVGSPGQKVVNRNPVHDGAKHGGHLMARKAASAAIAKIPFALSQHIASVYHPGNNRSAA
jgi:hypothetical protein